MPNKLDKTMMSSPYYAGYTQGKTAMPRPSAPRARAYAPSVQNRYGQPRAASARLREPEVLAAPLSKKEQRKLKRAKRRNLNYFFVMRRGVSFGMFLFFLIYIAALALSFIPLPYGINALFTVADNTTYLDRYEYESKKDEAGYNLIYEDKSQYIPATDAIIGFVDVITAMLTKAPAAAEEVAGEQESEVIDAAVPVKLSYNDYLALLEDRQSDFDVTPKIAYLIFKYFPAALAIAALTALIALFTSFGAARGRRVHKGFALAAIIMLIAGIAALAAGIVLSNLLHANPAGPFDFAYLQEFLTRVIMGPVYDKATALALPPLELVAGIQMLVIVIMPVLILIFSIFCRKRVSYKVFDK